jgi:GTP-binding protein Era
MLKKIGTSARIEIEHLMGTRVNLQLWVKVRREWRDSELYMKNYGYTDR